MLTLFFIIEPWSEGGGIRLLSSIGGHWISVFMGSFPPNNQIVNKYVFPFFTLNAILEPLCLCPVENFFE